MCNSHFAFLKRRASAPAPLDKHTNDLCIHAMHIQYRARELQRGATSLLRAHPLLFIFFNVKRVARGRKSVTERLLCLFSAVVFL